MNLLGKINQMYCSNRAKFVQSSWKVFCAVAHIIILGRQIIALWSKTPLLLGTEKKQYIYCSADSLTQFI